MDADNSDFREVCRRLSRKRFSGYGWVYEFETLPKSTRTNFSDQRIKPGYIPDLCTAEMTTFLKETNTNGN